MAMGVYDLGTARGVIHFTYDGAGIKQAQQDMDRVDSHSSQMGKHLASTAMTLGRIGVIAGGVVVALTAGIGALGAFGAKTASQVEQAQIAFTTMLGSGQKAQAFLLDLQDFAAKTPFEFPDLVSASQKLLAMGFAAKDVRPTLTAIGDAVAGLGGSAETIDQVTRALGQMMAKGKVQSDEMLQLTEAGIPAWQMLADKMGITIPEAMKKVEKGAVDAKTGVDALVTGMDKRFGGMMEKQAQTLAGLMSTLKDTFQMGLANAEQAIMPAMKGLVTNLINEAGPLTKSFANLFGAITPAIEGFARNIGPLLDALAKSFTAMGPELSYFFNMLIGGMAATLQAMAPAMPTIMEFVNVLGTQFFTILTNIGPEVGKLAGAFANFVRAFDPLINALIKGLIDLTPTLVPLIESAGQLAGALAPVVQDLVPVLIPLLRALAVVLKIIAPILPLMIEYWLAMKVVKQVASWISMLQKAFFALNMVMMQNPVMVVVAAIAALVMGIIYAYRHFKWFRDAIEAVWQAIQVAWDWVIKIGKAVGGFLVDAFNSTWNFLKKWGPAILAILMPIVGIPLLIYKYWGQISKFFEGIGKAIVDAFKAAGTWLLNVGKMLFDGLWTGIKAVWDNVIWPFISGLGQFLYNFMTKGFPAHMFNAGKAVFQALLDGITWVWDNVIWPYILYIPRKLIEFFVKGVDWLFQAGKDIITGLWNGFWAIAGTLHVWLGDNIFRPLTRFFIGAVSWLFNMGKDIITGLWNGMWAIASTVATWLTNNIFKPIGNFFWNGVNWLVSKGSEIITGLFNGLYSIAKTVGTWMTNNILNPIVNFFVFAGTWLIDKGGQIIGGLLGGIWNAMKGIGVWINNNVVQPLVNAVKWFFGIHSPSKVMMDIGWNIMEGLLKGLVRNDWINLVKKVFGGMPEALAAMVSKGLIDIANLPAPVADAVMNALQTQLPFMNSTFAKWASDALDSVLGLLDFGGGPSGNSMAIKAMQQAARSIMKQMFGWGEDQFRAFNALVMGESGWNPTIRNKESGAYGIPQALPANKMASEGADWASNPITQIRWMLKYIKAVYGDPISAFRIWTARSPHWYDTGGYLPKDRPALVGVPELWIPRGNGYMIPLSQMGAQISFGDFRFEISGTDPEKTADLAMQKFEKVVVPRIIRAVRAR